MRGSRGREGEEGGGGDEEFTVEFLWGRCVMSERSSRRKLL